MKPGLAGREVARFLRPELEVVPFRPRPELEELLDWCGTAEHVAARLVVGGGGTGKTRLALQLTQELAENGWWPLWVRRGREGKVAGAPRELGKPCVAVVDYAETRDGLAGLLRDAADISGGPDLRVVLLARGSGEWWQRLITSGDDRVAEMLAAPPIMLGPITAEGGPEELFEEALTAFAAQLEAERPRVPLRLRDSQPVVLVVHAAALLAVLDHAQGGSESGARTGLEVLAGVLAHEGRYWAQSAAARGLDLDVAVQRLAVMAGCLIGAENQTAAAALLSRIPDLADSAERRGKVARWLRDLYPETAAGASGEWLGSVRPDRVAEHLVVSELTDRPELIPGLFTGLAEDRAARALTVLARAALAENRALMLLRGALAADLENLAVPALPVAVETNEALGELLGEAIDSQQLSVSVLERIVRTAPYPSFALALPVAVALQQLAASSSDRSKRAGWLADLSNRLSDLGRREEALAAIEEATGIYRQLAEARPDEFLPDLAGSLNNRASCLSDLGRREDALAAIEEATGIYRQLAEARPDEFLPDLAGSLNNRASGLSDLGRREEALAAIEEAMGIYRRLAEARPDEFLPDLALLLNNRAGFLAYLGRLEEALDAIEEAVAIRRQLAEARPDAFLPNLANSLHNRAGCLSDLGRLEEALAATEEAAGIYRELAAARPDAFFPSLAAALNNRAGCLSDLGRREEALAAIEEAVAIRRQLAEARPDAFLPNLANSLHNQSNRLSDLGRGEEALDAIEEAAGIYRQLAKYRPDAFLPDLAGSLNNQSGFLAYLGRLEEALDAIEEAVAIRRRLAQARPDAFLSDLAGSLHDQSGFLAYLGRLEEALDAIEEAVAIRRQLAQARPDTFLPSLANSLRNLARLLTDLGQDSEALKAQAEAEAIRI